ncbi:HAMP domain-containing histidine kinase [Methylobacterium sp. C25]|uniref:sensor histidine kinase n=1 Tax=Methylobacterium sp. C25 TaxID=2721622 RepID=UPI001F40630C|nr:HAMP domain-containing sensor histidine kinase [Methylobacterium sp. C25]MCE4223503.1 HAMP domain-containing histidine kinase [Methylobacterium sp. C25]
MLSRIGLLGRLTLILMLALAVIIGAAIAIAHIERSTTRQTFTGPYPRLAQAAGIIGLMRDANPSLRSGILRAVNGLHIRASIVDSAPAEAPDLRRAPRIEATLRTFGGGEITGDLRAYTDASAPERRSIFRTEGRPARVTWQMPDGKVLIIEDVEPFRGLALRLLGLPPGLWIGLLGILVAGLALYTTQREMRPLRRLTAVAEGFDGGPVDPEASAIGSDGAPDIRRLARAVQGMQERVAGLLQERSFLIGAISHDIKTYLTRLRLRAEGVPDESARERMIGDVDAMADLIDTSLAFARGTAISQRRERVDLADLAAIEVAERDALGQPVSLVGGDAGGPDDAVVAGDAIALRRVLANLVDNAVKFGRERVEVALEVSTEACRVCVEDDGPGVSEAQRAAIFSPFYRVEGSRNRRTGGSGLGLAIARQIVEAHGGTLAVTEGRLGGARFSFSLPRAGRG